MILKSALRKYLSENAGVLEILITDKVFPNVAPTGTVNPIVTIQKLDDTPERDFEGPVGLSQAQFQIDLYSYDSDQIEALDRAVRIVLDGLIEFVIEDIFVRSCSVIRTSDDYLSPTDGSQKGEFHGSIDISVWYDFT